LLQQVRIKAITVMLRILVFMMSPFDLAVVHYYGV
jgi:hypothetical protein